MSWPNYPGGVALQEVGQSAASRWALMDPRQATFLPQDWEPEDHQKPPEGSWLGWLMLAGRGAGKTDACAKYVVDHVKGPPCVSGRRPHRMSVVAPTQGDAVDACVTGPSGIEMHDPSARFLPAAPGGSIVRWPNGSELRLFGAREPEDVERLRAGGNRCLVWMEELAAWRYLQQVFDQILFGLRLGPDPRWIASTTPKSRPLIKRFAKGFTYRGAWSVPFAGGQVVVRHATTDDNPHLPAHIRAALEEAYGGTTLGSQELHGRVIEQDDAAMWRREWLDAGRLLLDPAEVRRYLKRVTVGVDPSGGAGEQGIVVVGRYDRVVHDNTAPFQPAGSLIGSEEGTLIQQMAKIAAGIAGRALATSSVVKHGFVLDDRTATLSPDGWGRRAVEAAIDWEADDIVVETNYGGDMAQSVIQGAADAMGISISVKKVTATRGKRVRAEPVAALSERRTWHHVGIFEALEDQLCTWTPELDWSPDRLDAMVWPAWHMKLVSTIAQGQGQLPGSTVARKSVLPNRRQLDPRRLSPWR